MDRLGAFLDEGAAIRRQNHAAGGSVSPVGFPKRLFHHGLQYNLGECLIIVGLSFLIFLLTGDVVCFGNFSVCA